MPQDSFSNTSDSLIASSRDCFSIIPSDTAEITKVTKAIYVGTGGNLVLRLIDSELDVTFANVPSGTILDVRAAFVRATSTTASDIVGLA
ncbi:MAG: hypothetical protein AAF697_10235 [Pseudomonadota bacterium]